MMQWVKSGTRSACLFGVLLAVLAGCNGSDEKQANSTFDTVQTEQEPLIDDSKVPDVPVIGTVKAVPGTESPPPKVDGGKATPATGDRPTVMIGTGNTAGPGAEQAPGPAGGATANGGDDAIAPLFRHIDPPAPETLTVREGPFSKPVPEKATRFTETAPDTIGGATFQSSSALSYDLGNLVAVTSGDSSTFSNGKTFITPITGWLRYPEEALNGTTETAKYPVVVFLHGQHAINDPSYQGYDYLAADLAQHGYVVLSIDANAINADGDRSSLSRAQLVLGTLDRLRQIDGAGQINLGGSTGKLDPLKGRIDFTRIGIMGHSRGGQGVSNAIKFNKTRRGVTEADLLAAVKDGGAGSFSTFPDLVGAVAKSGVDKARSRRCGQEVQYFLCRWQWQRGPSLCLQGRFHAGADGFWRQYRLG
ncbi:hypothetical protein N8E89_08320 [Phyllobacterium sp. A18/5-2]|uniref:poly(ethylene terephthalate) hydrolase family protein n=1 Tax=Phyllobacterium sp. A18/5-2 TaxID=2978392 RepID=UPI0021C711B4|nr:hypothetical protein [Phyllobacterium sp. A18/5-2]UXN65602.1 hypothetical protein N8E89_08320 [Phyllobacterium sp. A18/5-2]